MPRGQKRSADQQAFGGPEWDKLQNDLRRLGPEIRNQFNREMRNVLARVARDAAKRAPVRSGKLRRGITTTVTQEQASVISKAPHARIVELGGRHPLWGNRSHWYPQKARPHMRPAFDAAQPVIDEAAQEAVKRAALAAGWR